MSILIIIQVIGSLQEYLPKSLRGLKIWEPNNNGWEKTQYEELLRRKEN